MGKKIILAIDDAAINLMAIKEILKNEYDVRVAKSGELALFILGSVPVDLLLIDIDLQGMSGFDFLKTVRELPLDKEIPAIFVTAHSTQDFFLKATLMGAIDYIVKPLNRETLLKKVNQALSV